MDLPIELKNNIDDLLTNHVDMNLLDESAKEISKRYRENDHDGTRLLTKDVEAIAYACARMPSTYGSVISALNWSFEMNDMNIDSVLDVGAGTGAATWAIHSLLGKKDYTCLEREDAMIQIGTALMKNQEDLKETSWKKFDITKDSIEGKYDLVVISYVINEIDNSYMNDIIDKLWNATNKMLVIIEPGTPRGFNNIRSIRESILNKGGHVIAPCTHEGKCPIPEDDWCQFTCRVARSKIHKMLKDGDAGFEDEKFSYIAVSKEEGNRVEQRILRHPIINKGYSEFKVCSVEGIKEVKLSKKDGERYKESKKKGAGDSLN